MKPVLLISLLLRKNYTETNFHWDFLCKIMTVRCRPVLRKSKWKVEAIICIWHVSRYLVFCNLATWWLRYLTWRLVIIYMYVLASLLSGRGPPQTRPPPACAVLVTGGALDARGWHLGPDISLVEPSTGRLQVTTIAVTRGCRVTAVLTDNTTQASM